MTNRLRLVLVLHQHQPVGNLDSENENVFRETYQPLIDTLADYPTLPVNLHVSGSLIDWLAARHPEYLHRLRDLAMAGRVEMMGGAYHDPILPMLPEVDRRGQIDSFSRRLGGLFGQRPRGFWLPERIWDPALAADLAACDIEHTVLDDYHFHATGLTNEQLRGYYLTEAAGQLIAAFAGDEHLRYLVPFAEPEEAIAYLRGIAQTTPGSVMVYADDAEKFGSWPGMHQRIYGERWLRRFFDALVANSSWLQVTTLGECIDHVPPLGKIYIPEGGYREMAIWSTVAEDPRFAVRQSISPTLADAGEAVDAQSVLFAENARNHGRLAAGTWRNFRVKYPEINEMYCRMLAVSRRCAAAEDDPQQVELARQALYRAQCGCAYWHGMFGGVYLPHLRQSVYQNLIEAESLLNLAAGRTGPWLSVTIDDLNLDVHKELLLANDHLSVRLAPEFGGQIYELDVFDKPINLLATLSRKQEPYHPAVNATGSGAGEPPRLIYDAYPRKSLLDHFFDPMTSLDDVARGAAAERGDFLGGRYRARVRRIENGLVTQLSRTGMAWGHTITLTKQLTLWAERSTIDIHYSLTGLPPGRPLRFAVEFNFAGLPPACADRYFVDGRGQTLADLGHRLEMGPASTLRLVDRWLGIDVGLSASDVAGFWAFPICSTSRSQRGLESIQQSVAVLPHWLVVGDAHGRYEIHMQLSIVTSSTSMKPQVVEFPAAEVPGQVGSLRHSGKSVRYVIDQPHPTAPPKGNSSPSARRVYEG